MDWPLNITLPGVALAFLSARDAPAVQALLEACDDFSRLVSGLPPEPEEGRELFSDLPPHKTLADKGVIGLYTGRKPDPAQPLLGLIDFVRDYPEDGTWFIGLMLLHPQARGQGLGRQVYQGFEAWARRNGAQAIQLGVVGDNLAGYRFWRSVGFEAVETRPPRLFGQKEQVVHILARHWHEQGNASRVAQREGE